MLSLMVVARVQMRLRAEMQHRAVMRLHAVMRLPATEAAVKMELARIVVAMTARIAAVKAALRLLQQGLLASVKWQHALEVQMLLVRMVLWTACTTWP